MAGALQLSPRSVLVDLACGMGGPGLWLAQATGAELIGVDISTVALEHARKRAIHLELAGVARFMSGTFADTGLDSASVDGAITVDALQYAPDKGAALDEVARLLRPGGRFVFACFAVEPGRVARVPIIGTDPVADYLPFLERSGFEILSYEESANWHARVTETYQAIIDARTPLTEELGEDAYAALFGEMTLTLQLQPYRSRVLVSAEKR